MSRTTLAAIALSAVAVAMAAPGEARANLVKNGGFEDYTPGALGAGDLTYSPLDFWTSPPIDAAGTITGNLLYTPGSGDTTGSYYSGGAFFYFHGPANGVNNGFTATSPVGGNYVGLDADPLYNGALSQEISGLQVGQEYVLGFWWATAQLAFAFGDTTEQLQVTFGGQTQSTEVLNTPSQGFQPWRFTTFTFTAESATQTLSFLAVGGPSGLPPFVLLDGVELNVVPEPSAVLMLTVGLLGLGVARRFRRAAGSPAA